MCGFANLQMLECQKKTRDCDHVKHCTCLESAWSHCNCEHVIRLTFSTKPSLTESLARLETLSLVPPHCDLFTSLSHWGILLCYFVEPPASILLYTVKYAGRDLIPYIPVQIRAVSVQDYPGNSCNAASPQLISLWMSGESGVILPKLQCIIPSHFLICSTCLVCKTRD